jgi:hypothetical protein
MADEGDTEQAINEGRVAALFVEEVATAEESDGESGDRSEPAQQSEPITYPFS